MKPKVVVIGGGTGTYTVLSGLKKYDLDLTAIVSMADSGGVAKVERDEFGILPNSDVRKSLLALSETEDSDILRKLFAYRFYKGVGISGITFGNFFLAALTDILGNQVDAMRTAGRILNIKGQVLPMSLEPTNLLARLEDNSLVLGESSIDGGNLIGKKRIEELTLIPKAKIYPLARKAIIDADLIVISPGDLYSSVIANLVVEGTREAIQKSMAVKVYIVNLIAKYGETYRFSALDHVSEIQKYLGGHVLNYVLMNNTELPNEVLGKYRKEQGYPVKDNLKDNSYKVIRGDYLFGMEIKRQKGDLLKRSMIRHDSDKLARELYQLL